MPEGIQHTLGECLNHKTPSHADVGFEFLGQSKKKVIIVLLAIAANINRKIISVLTARGINLRVLSSIT